MLAMDGESDASFLKVSLNLPSVKKPLFPYFSMQKEGNRSEVRLNEISQQCFRLQPFALNATLSLQE